MTTEDRRRAAQNAPACPWCDRVTGCDCIERRDCTRAGQVGHVDCGACLSNPAVPRYACRYDGYHGQTLETRYRRVWTEMRGLRLRLWVRGQATKELE